MSTLGVYNWEETSMSGMTSSQTHLGCLVARTVLGSDGKSFQQEVERLTADNGPEWLVNRTKAIWNAANHLRNGDMQSAIQLYQANSISYHKGSGLPKGAFKPVVKGYVDARKPSVVKRYAAVLRYYTGIKLDNLTPKQSRKAFAAITSESPSPDGWKDEYRQGISSLPVRSTFGLRSHLRFTEMSTDTRLSHMRITSNYHSSERLARSDRDKPAYSMALSFLTEAEIPAALEASTPLKHLRSYAKGMKGSGEREPVGRISPIQEQGAKARVVAMPSAHVQLAFVPLAVALDDFIRKDDFVSSVSCMHAQTKAVHAVKAKMAEGKPIFSIDLSSATDRFPRQYTEALLRDNGGGIWAEAISQISSSDWQSPWGKITYGAGQPMGLQGSFQMFHLSNIMVAAGAEASAYPQWAAEKNLGVTHDGTESPEVFLNGRTFYVLGDDIVISDEKVADAYRSSMERMGVDISAHKSFDGNIAEFAGFMVTNTNGGPLAFRPYKVPASNEVTNAIEFLDNIGVRVKKLARSKYWETQYIDYRNTVSDRDVDLSPLVSTREQEGGLPQKISRSTLDGIAGALYANPKRYHLPVRNENLSPFTEEWSERITTRVARVSPALGGPRKTLPRSLKETQKSIFDPRQVDPDEGKPIARVTKTLKSDPLMRREREGRMLAKSLIPTPEKVVDPDVPGVQGLVSKPEGTPEPALKSKPESAARRKLRLLVEDVSVNETDDFELDF